MGLCRAYVVEPQRIFVTSLVDALMDAGFEVTHVSDRFEMAQASSPKLRLVFLDLDVDTAFPEEVVRLARAAAPHARIVVYAWDGHEYLASGADTVISKTVEREEFVRTMRDVAWSLRA